MLLCLGVVEVRAANFYGSLFPLTNTPISESLHWTNGASVGLDWHNVNTTPGKAFGTQPGGAGYADSIAILSGVWSPNQSVKIYLHQTSTGTGGHQEMEALVRFHIGPHSAYGYECNASISGQYIQIVRWNGGVGSFDFVNNSVPFTGTLKDGDVVEFRMVGNIISTYLNGVLQHTDDVSTIGATDKTVWTNGNPGLGFYIDGSASDNNVFSITNYQASDDWTNVFFANGSAADVQTQINAATNGQIVAIPAGTFNWTTGITNPVAKSIKIAGMGASKLVGNSTTSLSVGTGSKTFTTQAGLAITPGQDVIAYYTPSGGAGQSGATSQTNMTGTVTSYSGTSLVCNITSVNGGGTRDRWTIGVGDDLTIITNNSTTGPLFKLYEGTVTNVDLTGIYLIFGANNGSSDGVDIVGGYKPARIYSNRFSVGNTGARAIEFLCNNGIVYNNSFDNRFDAGLASGNGIGNNDEGITVKALGLTQSWSNNSTMGMADIGYTNNVYIQANYIAAMSGESMDFDDNSRAVLSFNIFDQSSVVSHGCETSPYGLRHFEMISNVCYFVSSGPDAFGVNQWFLYRGGSAVIRGNVFPLLTSSQWGTKSIINMQDQAIRRGSTQPGCITSYPAPHQIGQGYISGSTFTVSFPNSINGATSFTESLEPSYIYNNTGSAGDSVTLTEYNPDDCGNGQLIANYLVSGRDYYVSTAKPGYDMGTFPNPYRTDASDPTVIVSPQDVAVNAGANATFTVGAIGTGISAYQWTFNGSAVGTGSSYTRNSVTSGDNNGLVAVTVTGTKGTFTTGNALLTVNGSGAAPTITVQPQNQTVTAPATATMSVTATGTAPLGYQWSKNGSTIAGATQSSYTTPATTYPTDNGATFYVVVSNSVGTLQSSTATLTVNPATWYVSPSGSDGASGAIGAPFATASHAISVASLGDTILFRAGTYYQRIYTASPGLTFASYPGELATFDGAFTNTTSFTGLLIADVGAYGTTFRDLNVAHANYAGLIMQDRLCLATNVFSYSNMENGIIFQNAGSNGVAVNCRVFYNCMANENFTATRGNHATGLTAANGATGCTLGPGNIVWNNWGEGVSTFSVTGTTIIGNTIYDNATEAYLSDCRYVLFASNLVYSTANNICRNASSLRDQCGLMIGDEQQNPASFQNTIINNLFYGSYNNVYAWLTVGMTNNVFANNTFANAAAGSDANVYILGTHSDGTGWTNNLFVQNGSITNWLANSTNGMSFSHNLCWPSASISGAGAGDVIANPTLVQSGGVGPGQLTYNWFRPQVGSAALAAGLALPSVTVDYLNVTRSSPPSIGAFELGVAVAGLPNWTIGSETGAGFTR